MKRDIEYILVASVIFTPLGFIPPLAHRLINRANDAAHYCNKVNASNPNYNPLPEILLFVLVWLTQMALWFALPIFIISNVFG